MAKKQPKRAFARKPAPKTTEPRKTYTVGFDCTNCFNKFDAEFEFGIMAVTAECPRCGCDTSTRRQPVKPVPALPLEPPAEPIKIPPWVKRSPPTPWKNPFEGGIESVYLFESPRTAEEQRAAEEREKAYFRGLGEAYGYNGVEALVAVRDYLQPIIDNCLVEAAGVARQVELALE